MDNSIFLSYCFGNEDANYFGLGKIKYDQVSDFAKRKGIEMDYAEKWLCTNITDDSVIYRFIQQ